LRADEFLEQHLFVAEVKVDRPLGDAGAARDIVEPRGGKTARGEFLQRGGEDGFLALGTLRGPRLRRVLAPAAVRGFPCLFALLATALATANDPLLTDWSVIKI
jgi:hypothetical protein